MAVEFEAYKILNWKNKVGESQNDLFNGETMW